MTPQFRTAPPELDSLLGPKWVEHRDSEAGSKLIAVLVKGLGAGEKKEDVELWIRSRGGVGTKRRTDAGGRRLGARAEAFSPEKGGAPIGANSELGRLLNNSAEWNAIVRTAEWILLSSSPSSARVRDRRSYLVTALYAFALLPLSGEPADGRPTRVERNAGLRASFAVMVNKMLDDEVSWVTDIVTEPRLAQRTGYEMRAIQRYLNQLEDLGAVKHLNPGRGRNGRYLVRRPSQARARMLVPFRASMDALVDELCADVPGARPGWNPLAEVLRSASHCLWGHSDVLNYTHWALLLSDAAGLPAEDLGIRAPMQKRLRAELDEALRRTTTTATLREALEQLAADPALGKVNVESGERESARQHADRALVAYEARAAARTELIAAHRDVTGEIHDGLTDLLSRDGFSIPRPAYTYKTEAAGNKALGSFARWVFSMQLAVADLDDTFKRHGVTPLMNKLRVAGYGEATATDAVRFIMTGDTTGLDQDLVQLLGRATRTTIDYNVGRYLHNETAEVTVIDENEDWANGTE